MGLLDFFKRDARGATPASAAMSGEQANQARLRARRRLIGAVVLLGVGVVAFPILFETQPRPIPVDIPIEIPSRDSVAPLAMPVPKPAIPKPPAPVAEAPREPTVAASAVPANPKPAEVTAKPAEPVKPAPTVAPKEVIVPPKPAAQAAPSPAAPAAEGRFVVQVGAFAEASAVREARAKVEKLGLATYTQVVETANGNRTRVRIGPFATREEAERAAATVKAAGLPGAVLTL
jgi:DedD protein